MTIDRPSRSWVRARVGLFVVVAGGLAVAGAIRGVPEVDQLRDEVAGAGAWAPWVSVLLFAAVCLGAVPKNVLAATTGLLFGMKLGVLIVLAGAMLSALSAFALARALARPAVSGLGGPRWTRLESGVQRHGLVTVLVARLSPIVPFTVFSYTAGMTSLGVRTFVVGTAVGMVPGSVAYVALGSYGASLGPWPTAVLLLLVLAVVLLVAPRRWRPGISERGASVARSDPDRAAGPPARRRPRPRPLG